MNLGGTTVFVIATDGTGYSWGDASSGQLANGTTSPDRSTPAATTNLNNLRQISTSYGSSHHAIRHTGVSVGWGANSSGHVGDGTTSTRSSPTTVTGLPQARSLVTGGYMARARGQNGAGFGWGQNLYGQVGNGTTSSATSPTAAPLTDGMRQLASGARFNMGIAPNSDVYGWGINSDLQIGVAGTGDKTSPTLTNYPKMRQMAAGGFHSMGISLDGTLLSTGRNNQSQRGWGTSSDSSAVNPVLNTPTVGDTRGPVPNPQSGIGVADSPTQITWTQSQAYDDSSGLWGAGPYGWNCEYFMVGFETCTTAHGTISRTATRTQIDSGLAPNTSYTKYMMTRDNSMNITYGTLTTWTLANPPTGLAATAGWNSTDSHYIDLSWNAPAVGGANGYAVFSSLDGYSTPIAEPSGTSYRHTNRTANTSYTYKVCSKNGEDIIETTCTSLVSRTSTLVAPTGAAISNVITTGFNVSWSTLASADTYQVLVYSNTTCSTLVNTYTTSSPSQAVSGLSLDRVYRIKLQARSTASAAYGQQTACIALPGVGRTSLGVGLDTGTLNLGSGTPGQTIEDENVIEVDSYGATRFSLSMQKSALLTSGANTIADNGSGTIGTPGNWSGTGFGFSISSAPGNITKWNSGTRFAPVPNTNTLIHDTGAVLTANQNNHSEIRVRYRVVGNANQAPGTYSTTITYTLTPLT